VTAFSGYIGNYDVTSARRSQGDRRERGLCGGGIGAVPLEPAGMYSYDGSRVITQLQIEEQLRQGDVAAKNVSSSSASGTLRGTRVLFTDLLSDRSKERMILKERHPEAHVTILYRDMQMYGAEKEQMLWDARGMEVRFDVYDPQQPLRLRNRQSVTISRSLAIFANWPLIWWSSHTPGGASGYRSPGTDDADPHGWQRFLHGSPR